MRLKDKVAIVTGSGRGLGKGIAMKLAEEGAKVVIADMAAADDTVAEIVAKGGTASAFAVNVSKQEEVQALIKYAIDTYGTLDIMVNNAGITRDGLLARMSEENFDTVIAVNEKSVFNMTKFVGSVMMKQRSGKIINLSSVAGLWGNPGQLNYSASKAAIIGMTKTVAKELGSRGITCNAVAPGFIKTPMTDKLTEAQKENILRMIDMRRYGTVEEISGVVSFLASKDASYVTGQVIEISGGLSM